MEELFNLIPNEKIRLAVIIVIYLALGWNVIRQAIRNLTFGDFFDENFLMLVATIGAFCVGEYEEAVMVMLLYRIGEWLQDKAVDKSRRAISDLMDIRPDSANLLGEDGEIKTVKPQEVPVGSIIVIKPGERVPLDGTVIEGSSRLDTAALTGESVPRDVCVGSDICSGTINLDGLIKVKTTAPMEQSTANRILELVENAAASRAKAENFITKFSRIYTPAVCGFALALAVIPSLITGNWSEWVHRGLIFLVVSCPCALVISIPLGFFGGIGGASSKGILIKGGNYLETLSKVDTVVFDKTGTLTKGVFRVIAVHPEGEEPLSRERLLELATLAESFSNHPIARSLAEEYGKHVDKSRVSDAKEVIGQGISALVDGLRVSCGNKHFMDTLGLSYEDCEIPGTNVHVAVEGKYVGHIVISDQIKEDSPAAVEALRKAGISKLVMVTGDKQSIGAAVAETLNLDEFHAEILPAGKVEITKQLMEALPEGKKLAFVGDGINDAPVLTQADLGIAMGGMGSAAAVEAADIVLMTDKPSDIALALRIAKKTMRIVKENIWFSIGIKLLVLVLTALGMGTMWMASFADTGVCLIAILNSMRCLRCK